GARGPDGPAGPAGPRGSAGQDGAYCPCPPRTIKTPRMIDFYDDIVELDNIEGS
ncbi:unnamed protein product, partial [Cylicostephanus goldi]